MTRTKIVHPDKVGIPHFFPFTFAFFLQKHPYLKKQTQFFAVFSPKTAIRRNQSQLNPIQSQFLEIMLILLSCQKNSHPDKVGIPHFCPFTFSFYLYKNTFLCKTNPNFLVSSSKTTIWRKNEPKANPNKAKQSQTAKQPK